MTRGQRIRDLMDKTSVSVNEMADQIGKSAQYVSNILADRIKEPTWETRKLMAAKLNVTMQYLEEGIDEEVIYYDEPEILSRLPKDLQEFVQKEENTPYLILAKQLSAYDLAKLTDREMTFLIDWLKMAIEKNNSTTN